jgi:hypothetical protein
MTKVDDQSGDRLARDAPAMQNWQISSDFFSQWCQLAVCEPIDCSTGDSHLVTRSGHAVRSSAVSEAGSGADQRFLDAAG